MSLPKLKFGHPLVILFFLVYLLIGLFTFKDYGISWDEPDQRQIGYTNFVYVFQHDKSLLKFPDRFHGAAFELPLVIIERTAHLQDSRSTYLMRHFLTFLTFYVAVVVFYFLNKKIFGSFKWGLVASLILMLSPRIFADSFYNSKDVPFLSFYIISFFTLLKFLDKKEWKWLIIHALITAILVDIRVTGIVVVAVTLFALVFKRVTPSKITAHLILTFLLITLFWPVLWSNPFNLFLAIKDQANFAFQSNLPVLYMGHYISPFSLPWHYISVWIFISTPVVYSLLFLFGLVKSIKELLHKNIINWIILLLLFGPLISVIVLHSTLYDGWRHLYFIYPLIVILVIKGLKWMPRLLTPFLILQIILVLGFMIQNHPFENVYFNDLLSKDMKSAKANFELDYWGLSYRKALEYIVKTDSSPKIPLVVANNPGNSNSLLLNLSDRSRLEYLADDDIKNAKYFLSNYRWHYTDYNYPNEVYNIQINGAKIMVVYKLKD